MELWGLLLPIVLFVLTLIIIFLLRAGDKRDRNLKRIKDVQEKLRTESAKASSQLKETTQQAANDVNAMANHVQMLTHSVDEKLMDLQRKSDDLTKLQAVMNSYRQVLEGLKQTTMQAEARIKDVNSDTQKLEKIREEIGEFQQKFEMMKGDIGTTLHSTLETITQSETETKAHLDAYSVATLEKSAQAGKELDTFMDSLHKASDDALATVSKQTDELKDFGRQADALVTASKARFNQLQADSFSQVNNDLSSFTTACAEKLEVVFKQTVEQIDTSFATMVRTSQIFINELDSRLASTKEISATLDAKEARTLADLANKIQEYSDQISNSQSVVQTQENRKRQMDESITMMKEEMENLHDELEKMKTEKASIIKEMEERAAQERQSKEVPEGLQIPTGPQPIIFPPLEETEPITDEPKNAIWTGNASVEKQEQPELPFSSESEEPQEEPEIQEPEPQAEVTLHEEPEEQEEPIIPEVLEQHEKTEEQEEPVVKAEPLVEDLELSDLEEPSPDDIESEEEVSVPQVETKTIDHKEPLPIPEFEPDFVKEDKNVEPDEIPDMSDLEETDTDTKKKPKVDYVPVGKEEEIRLDDDN